MIIVNQIFDQKYFLKQKQKKTRKKEKKSEISQLGHRAQLSAPTARRYIDKQ